MDEKEINNIANLIKSAQSNIIYYTNKDITDEKQHYIFGGIKSSYILDKVNDKKIIYKNKINKLLLTKCKNTDIILDKIISGIDLINCTNCSIKIESINIVVNIENSSNINILGSLSNDSFLILFKNMNIYHNEKILRSTPFNDLVYSSYGCIEINRSNLLNNYDTYIIV